MLNPEVQNAYISILKEELVPATGCTEPIALAYAAARMRAILGAAPERIVAEVSGNIIKNVKSVVVPNTGGRKGIQAAIAAGVVSGKAEKILQVISGVPAAAHPAIPADPHNPPHHLPPLPPRHSPIPPKTHTNPPTPTPPHTTPPPH